MSAVPLPAVPQSPAAGFYAINNQFLMNGPKGFEEYKMLENDIMFVRMDFPGVPDDGVTVTLDASKTLLNVVAHAPKVHKHDFSHRKYFTMTGLVCGCCQISSFTYQMTDSVLRLHISKTNIVDPQLPTCTAFLSGIRLARDVCKCLPYSRCVVAVPLEFLLGFTITGIPISRPGFIGSGVDATPDCA
ncbi:Heat shock protein HSP20/alpha crystallin family [Raphanus sativus]|nr:Heat shock protein HSP20/alpha crystallin family [Raphanus sativus]